MYNSVTHELKYTGYPTTYMNNYFSWTQTDLSEQLLQTTPSACYHICGNFYKIIYRQICKYLELNKLP